MNIVVTGASSGIGYETALKYASHAENKVLALSRNPDKLKELAGRSASGNIIGVSIDLSSFDYSHLDLVMEEHGISHIDILIHNAGQLINKPFESIMPGEWEDIYRANVFGPAQLTRHLLPKLGGNERSHIVMISSMGGVNGTSKFAGLSAYSSSKGALTTLAECLAEEFRDRNISVNCLALGSVQTEMLMKAFPRYTTLMTAERMAGYIYDFGIKGSDYFNGKILPVSTGNP